MALAARKGHVASARRPVNDGVVRSLLIFERDYSAPSITQGFGFSVSFSTGDFDLFGGAVLLWAKRRQVPHADKIAHERAGQTTRKCAIGWWRWGRKILGDGHRGCHVRQYCEVPGAW